MRGLRLLLVVTLSAVVVAVPAAAAATQSSSTAGDVVFQDWSGPVHTWWTALDGVQGTAGRFEMQGAWWSWAADITCVAVVSPTEAYLGGPVTEVSDPEHVGKMMLTYVVDGTPAQATDALWSSLFAWDTCATLGTQMPVNGPFPVSGGDLTVSSQGLLASATGVAAYPTSAVVGEAIELTGRVGIAGESVGGRSVSITRRLAGGGVSPVATVTTNTDGTFIATDTMPSGSVVYTATFAPTATSLGSTATAKVKLVKSEAALTLQVSDTRVEFGEDVELTAHLEGGTTNREVAFYGEIAGRSPRLIARRTVTAAGNASVSVTPKENTTFTAAYAGDPAWTSANSKAVTTSVRPRWSAKMIGGYATSGAYRLYRYTSACHDSRTGCPHFLFSLAPSHAGTRVACDAQYYANGRWRGDRITFKLDDRGRLELWYFYSDRSVIGVRQRLRVVFGGDRDHVTSTSAWLYFRVTG